ncbi:MAG: hypothetical protein WC718_14930 [Phycisphaerales bacterium]
MRLTERQAQWMHVAFNVATVWFHAAMLAAAFWGCIVLSVITFMFVCDVASVEIGPLVIKR